MKSPQPPEVFKWISRVLLVQRAHRCSPVSTKLIDPSTFNFCYSSADLQVTPLPYARSMTTRRSMALIPGVVAHECRTAPGPRSFAQCHPGILRLREHEHLKR